MSSLAGLAIGLSTILAIAACILAPMCYGLAGVYIRGTPEARSPWQSRGEASSWAG